MAALVVTLLVVFSGFGQPVLAVGPKPIQNLGELPRVPADKEVKGETLQRKIIAVDVQRRRMYYVFVRSNVAHLVDYDISKTIPRPLSDSLVPDLSRNTGPYLTALDTRRQLLYFVDPYSDSSAVGTTLQVFDIAKHKEQSSWSIQASAPGFIATGIVYAPQDDRAYLIGRLSTQAFLENASSVGAIPVAPTAVVALNLKARSVAWIRPVTECVQPLSGLGTGSFIARSGIHDALYFFCIPSGLPSITVPGGTGLVRLTIAPNATQGQAVGFGVEFFPVSGSYFSSPNAGIVGIDHPSDRVFVQSVSTDTPGAWVFDGRISAWVGLIAAPDSFDYFLGINEGNGHYYITPNVSRYIVLSNARMTPPPQGDVYKDLLAQGQVVTDPLTRRLFVGLQTKNVLTDRFYVLNDNTPDPEQDVPINYDDLTTNIDEGPSTIAAFSGSIDGFGARAFLVGGTGGAQSPVGSDLVNTVLDFYKVVPKSIQEHLFTPAVQKGDRGLYLANVAGLDLRDSGASSSAQAVAPDDATDSEYGTYVNFVASTPANAAADSLKWPYQAAVCLDGGGSPMNPKENNAEAKCDLSQDEASAATSMSALALGPLTIASASFDSTASRSPDTGVTTTTHALARGIDISLPPVGSISIGRILATATTIAHGRPGSAKVMYVRTIEDVVIKDGTGHVVYSCPSGCDPQQVADRVNTTLGAKIRMDVPEVEEISTPRGAFSTARKSLRDYLAGQAQNNDDSRAVPAIQLTINNDSADKSRIQVQLAAIEASSIYGISLLTEPPLGDQIVPPISVNPPPIPPLPVPNQGGGGQGTVGNLGGGYSTRLLGGAFLLARSPRDIAIVLLIFAVIAGAIMSAYRRHSLIKHLEEEG